ncbi:MAG: hypothetical protein ACRBFS_12515 [Aureispira sp.]
MHIEFNKLGVIVESKDKAYLSDNIYIETEDINSNFCCIIITDALGSGDEVCSIDGLEETFKERGWVVEWGDCILPQQHS